MLAFDPYTGSYNEYVHDIPHVWKHMIRHPDNNYIGYIGGDTWILVFSNFAGKRRHKTSISEKRPRVPAWHPSDYDTTWYHDIKSIKNHCVTFNAWLPQTCTRLYMNINYWESC